MRDKFFHYAADGKHFVVTQKGYESIFYLKKHLEVGKPIPSYEYKVPVIWEENGWVEEVEK